MSKAEIQGQYAKERAQETRSQFKTCCLNSYQCDCGTPNCSTCTAVYHTECAYDVESDHRRKAALKRDIKVLQEQNGALGVIIASLKTASQSEVADIVQSIREDQDLDLIAESLKRNVTLTETSEGSSIESDLSYMIGKPSAHDEPGVLKHYGHTSSMSLVSDPNFPAFDIRRKEAWTSVTRDAQLVEHLTELYFCWSHPVYVLLSKHMFLHDMAKGNSKYCSPLLVNALLASPCLLSDRLEARAEPSNPATAGNHFFAEAKRLLDADDSSCLTTVQALAIMALAEPSRGNNSNGWKLAGRAFRMAIELGLHLSFGSDGKVGPTETEARRITFWGLFNLEGIFALSLGRISQIPSSAINLERLCILEQLEQQPWKPYTDYGVVNIPGAGQAGYTYMLSHQTALLTEIVNDALHMFYAPRERLTSRKLLDFYKRYTKWYKNLPRGLHLSEIMLPQLLLLQ